MQNPFTRLKHYKPDKIHPKENHATECLAACLHFSDELRESFVEFLFNGMQMEFPKKGKFEIQTQQMAGEFGIPDLVLEGEGGSRIAVEVKVGAQLTKSQVAKYGQWLRENNDDAQFLFSLEKEHYVAFDIDQVSGVGGRRTKWRDLYDWFRAHAKNYEAVTAKLVASLCDYLEDEGIVSTWKPAQILAYGPGLRAKDALRHCFARVTDALQTVDPKYETEERILAGEWPRLEVSHPDWEKIFGSGYLGRVWAFYEADGVWGSTENRFYFCIVTWNNAFESDWSIAQKHLKEWAQKLIAAGFEHNTRFKSGREIEGEQGLEESNQIPREAEASLRDETRSYIDATTIKRLSDDQLVKEIVNRITELSEAVFKLR